MAARRSLLSQVRRTLEERKLVPSTSSSILIACSGGADSTTLVHVLAALATELRLKLHVASVDHGLRPESSTEVKQVGEWARSLGLTFHGLKLHGLKASKEQASLQAAARNERYRVLLELAQRLACERVATGHTADDQAETVIARFMRGPSLRGLAAIAPLREDGVMRPLMDSSRQEVREYAEQHCLPILEDPSNQNQRFERVRIRTHLLPAMLSENPRLVEQLCALSEDARHMSDVVKWLAHTFFETRAGATGLNTTELLSLPESVRRAVLQEWIQQTVKQELTRKHLLALERTIAKGGEVLLPKDWIAYRTKNDNLLCLERKSLKLSQTRSSVR